MWISSNAFCSMESIIFFFSTRTIISFQVRFFKGIAWIFLFPSGPIFLYEQMAVFVHLTCLKDFFHYFYILDNWWPYLCTKRIAQQENPNGNRYWRTETCWGKSQSEVQVLYIGDREVGGRFGFYRHRERYDRLKC